MAQEEKKRTRRRTESHGLMEPPSSKRVLKPDQEMVIGHAPVTSPVDGQWRFEFHLKTLRLDRHLCVKC